MSIKIVCLKNAGSKAVEKTSKQKKLEDETRVAELKAELDAITKKAMEREKKKPAKEKEKEDKETEDDELNDDDEDMNAVSKNINTLPFLNKGTFLKSKKIILC